MLRVAIWAETTCMPGNGAETPLYEHGVSKQVSPQPVKPRPSARSMYLTHKLVEPNLVWRAFARLAEATPPLYKVFTWIEEKTKRQLFGCSMCAQCALPTTAFTCPQTCPKQLRNGPCGGAFPDGSCEVYPETKCVWVTAYERAEETGHVEDLRRLVRPIDHRKWGQSSWINFWRDRDEDLWTEDNALDKPASL